MSRQAVSGQAWSGRAVPAPGQGTTGLRLSVTVAAGSPAALPRVVALLHRRGAVVSCLVYAHVDEELGMLVVDVAAPCPPAHLIDALRRLVEVLEVRAGPAR